MSVMGFGKTQIRYDMFDVERDAAEAKRFTRCERIYHIGQEQAWDGKDVLPMLLAEHGGVRIAPEKKAALERVFAIIMWGELAAWKISAQLADRLVPLEAKMAATSQAHDEARHFYVMHDYLSELGYVPERMGRAPQALLDLVLETEKTAYKLIGMQLMIETMALGIFQAMRSTGVEPVLCELLKYYERDEARHVGLGMQYLPDLMRGMGPLDVLAMSLFQVRLVGFALWELKMLENDFIVLGIDPRELIDKTQKKQLAATQEAWHAIGIEGVDADDNFISRSLAATIEMIFPWTPELPMKERAKLAVHALRHGNRVKQSVDEQFSEHERHRIKTARGAWVE
jgi:hypothetical protein